MFAADVAMKRTGVTCDEREKLVIDTELVDPPKDGLWAERWTVRYCDRLYSKKIEFMPDGVGGDDIRYQGGVCPLIGCPKPEAGR